MHPALNCCHSPRPPSAMLSVNVMHVARLLSVRSARLGLLPPTGMDTGLFAAAFVSANGQTGRVRASSQATSNTGSVHVKSSIGCAAAVLALALNNHRQRRGSGAAGRHLRITHRKCRLESQTQTCSPAGPQSGTATSCSEHQQQESEVGLTRNAGRLLLPLPARPPACALTSLR